MHPNDKVAIFWDYGNCPIPEGIPANAVANAVATEAQAFGDIAVFKAYIQDIDKVTESCCSELHSSVISLIDCRDEVPEKMIIVDMLIYVFDNPTPSTIILITGDSDSESNFAYALAVLRNRHYRVIIVAPPHAHQSLCMHASSMVDWRQVILNLDSGVGSSGGPQSRDSPPALLVGEALEKVPHTIPNWESDAQLDTVCWNTSPTAELLCDSPLWAQRTAEPLDIQLEATSEPLSEYPPVPTSEDYESPYAHTPTYTVTAGSDSESDFIPDDTAISDGDPEDETASNVTLSYFDVDETSNAVEALIKILIEFREDGIHRPTRTAVLAQLSLNTYRVQEVTIEHAAIIQSAIACGLVVVGSCADGDSGGGKGKTEDAKGEEDWIGLHSAATPRPKFRFSEDTSLVNLKHSPIPQPSRLPSTDTGNQVGKSVHSGPQSQVSTPTVQLAPSPSPSLNVANPPTALRTIQSQFEVLIRTLGGNQKRGEFKTLRAHLAAQIANGGRTYSVAGFTGFRPYIKHAVDRSIVEVGGKGSKAWVRLLPEWHDAVSSPPLVAPPNLDSNGDINPSISLTIPPQFEILVQTLYDHQQKGQLRTLCSQLAAQIEKGGITNTQGGFTGFRPHLLQAVEQNIVEVGRGSKGGSEWVSLLPEWSDAMAELHNARYAQQFTSLIRVLRRLRQQGKPNPICSQISCLLGKSAYQEAGVTKWGKYVELAMKKGIVTIEGSFHCGRVTLKPDWCTT